MPYETEVLLSADVSHKVLRTTTVLEYLYELYNSLGGRGDFHAEATKKLVGQIVLTRYCFNPLTPASDQHINSLYNFNIL